MLGVKRQTSTLAVLAECGRFPLHIRQQFSTIKYFCRLSTLPESHILKKCLNNQAKLSNQGQDNWYTKVKSILQNHGTETNPLLSSKNSQKFLNSFKMKLYDSEKTRILETLADSEQQPKLRTYKLFKTDYRIENYLVAGLPKKSINKIARFRTSSHNLHIETGRYKRPPTPETQRICAKCNSGEVEDEFHCLMVCSKYSQHRALMISSVENLIPNFNNKNVQEKFIAIMASKDPTVLKSLGKFLCIVFE